MATAYLISKFISDYEPRKQLLNDIRSHNHGVHWHLTLFQKGLLDNGQRDLIEATYDYYWGRYTAGVDGKDLGLGLLQVRDRLAKFANNCADVQFLAVYLQTVTASSKAQAQRAARETKEAIETQIARISTYKPFIDFLSEKFDDFLVTPGTNGDAWRLKSDTKSGHYLTSQYAYGMGLGGPFLWQTAKRPWVALIEGPPATEKEPWESSRQALNWAIESCPDAPGFYNLVGFRGEADKKVNLRWELKVSSDGTIFNDRNWGIYSGFSPHDGINNRYTCDWKGENVQFKVILLDGSTKESLKIRLVDRDFSRRDKVKFKWFSKDEDAHKFTLVYLPSIKDDRIKENALYNKSKLSSFSWRLEPLAHIMLQTKKSRGESHHMCWNRGPRDTCEIPTTRGGRPHSVVHMYITLHPVRIYCME